MVKATPEFETVLGPDPSSTLPARTPIDWVISWASLQVSNSLTRFVTTRASRRRRRRKPGTEDDCEIFHSFMLQDTKGSEYGSTIGVPGTECSSSVVASCFTQRTVDGTTMPRRIGCCCTIWDCPAASRRFVPILRIGRVVQYVAHCRSPLADNFFFCEAASTVHPLFLRYYHRNAAGERGQAKLYLFFLSLLPACKSLNGKTRNSLVRSA